MIEIDLSHHFETTKRTNTKPPHIPMKLPIKSALVAFVALLFGACAATMTAPSYEPVATVRIQEWSAAYYGSASAGVGTLKFNGQRRNFTISGLGAGGMGGQKVSAYGRVYNLNRLADFPGTYRGVSRGLTLIQGQMHAKLENQNGVVIYLAGETEGLASSLGIQSFVVTLTD
jgi:hypothetical protein